MGGLRGMGIAEFEYKKAVIPENFLFAQRKKIYPESSRYFRKCRKTSFSTYGTARWIPDKFASEFSGMTVFNNHAASIANSKIF